MKNNIFAIIFILGLIVMGASVGHYLGRFHILIPEVKSEITFNQKLSELFWYYEHDLIIDYELRAAAEHMYYDYCEGVPIDSLQPIKYIFYEAND